MIPAESQSQAIEAIYARFFEDWIDGRILALIGYQPKVYWRGVEEPAKPDMSRYWARVSTQGVIERQTTISACVEKPGQRRYESSGLAYVQLFCPQSDARAMELGRAVSKICRDSWRGKDAANIVLFRNVRVNELDPESGSYRFNVVAEYEYDEIG